ncbi:MAG: S49 family peptidase, partial [Polyangiaceae bacterium]
RRGRRGRRMMLRALVAALLATVALGCEGRPRSTLEGKGSHGSPRTGPWVAVVDISDGLPEQASGSLLGLGGKPPTMSDLAGELERLEREGTARGVLVRFGTARIGLGRSVEVGSLLARLRAKVPVYCHADDLANGTMYVAARGCSRIWVSPASSVDVIGLAAQTIYFHKLLAEELGLSVDFLQVGRFKGAEEPFTRDGPSPEARASLETTLADLRGSWLDGLAAGRPSVARPALEDGPYSAQAAKERGLVDDIGYFDEARDALEKAVGAVRSQVRFGAGSQNGVGGGLGQAVRDLAGDSFGGAPVAVLHASGAISLEGGGLLEGGGIVESRLVRVVGRLERDEDVKAVVLRIDSPGGSALASDLLWHALMRLREKKPLVVSVGDMAASGGYYLASTGSAIFADETSIVGSIGVVGGKIAADKALAKVGVHAETFAARPDDGGAAARAAYESLLTPWDEPTRQRVFETMTRVYDLFLARVAEGRGITVAKVADSAEGRIFGGLDAKGRGLVDEIGGLEEAIARARALAHLPGDAPTADAEESRGLLQNLLEDDPAPEARRTPLAGQVVESLAPEVVPFVGSLVGLAKGDGAVCALPFALTVR